MSNSFETLWTAALLAPQSMEFPRQEYWNGLPFPPPGDLPDPRIEPTLPVSSTLAGGFFTTRAAGEALKCRRKSKQRILVEFQATQ